MKKLLKQFLKSVGFYHFFARIYTYVTFKLRGTSSNYWETRYKKGGTSGAGSYNRLAEFKAEVLNRFCKLHNIQSVVEWGCGDGNQLSYMNYIEYLGLDVSEQAIKLCKDKFCKDTTKEFSVITSNHKLSKHYNLAISLDVIYHLVEDDVFEEYMKNLFSSSDKFVCIYSCNFNDKQNCHVRPREFVKFINDNFSNFQLIDHKENKYPYDESKPDDTSWSEFFFYQRF